MCVTVLIILAAVALSSAERLVPSVRRVDADDASAVASAARRGDRVTLRCLLRETSAPLLVSWYRNGGELVHNTSKIHLLGPRLNIDKIDSRDIGVYSCGVRASDDRVYISSGYALTLRDGRTRAHRAAAPGALRFSPPPLDKKLELDGTGRIHCKVLGGTQANVTWYQNLEEPLPEDAASMNGTLVFAPAQRRHRGNYTCRASDGEEVISRTIAVDVVVSPRITEPASGAVMSVPENSTAWLHCRATGDPPPTTHWHRASAPLTQAQVSVEAEDGTFTGNNTRIRLYRNGSMLITFATLDDSDSYGCIAGSAAGLVRSELVLVVLPGSEAAASGVGGKAVVVSVSVAAAYMLLVLAMMLYWRRRRSRRRRGEKIEMNSVEGGEEKLMETDGHKRNGLKPDTLDPARSDNSEVSAVSRGSRQYRHLSAPRSLLTDLVPLGRGEYGEVILAQVDVRQLRRHQARDKDSASEEPKIRPVMVKALSSEEEPHQAEFRRTLELLTRVRHEGVVRLLAVCNEARPHYMVLEYTDWGDLKQFLLATRSAAPRPPPLSAPQAAALVVQLAAAGGALAAARLCHRDIGARNCLVTSRLHLKLTLAAMTRGPHSREYYKHVNRVIPLRWLPSESVFESDYSTKSDVHMFAVTVWEIMHGGELPYGDLSDASVVSQLQSSSLSLTWDGSLQLPAGFVPLMERCVSPSPDVRPQFEDISRELTEILQSLPAPAQPTEEAKE